MFFPALRQSKYVGIRCGAKREKSLFCEKLFRGFECAEERCSTKDDFYKVLEASPIPRVKEKHNLPFKIGRPAFFAGRFFISKGLRRVKEGRGIRERGGEEKEGGLFDGRQITGTESDGQEKENGDGCASKEETGA